MPSAASSSQTDIRQLLIGNGSNAIDSTSIIDSIPVGPAHSQAGTVAGQSAISAPRTDRVIRPRCWLHAEQGIQWFYIVFHAMRGVTFAPSVALDGRSITLRLEFPDLLPENLAPLTSISEKLPGYIDEVTFECPGLRLSGNTVERLPLESPALLGWRYHTMDLAAEVHQAPPVMIPL